MKAKDWAWTLGVASATAILFHFDYDIDERVRHTKEKSGFVREVSPVVTEFGNTYEIGRAHV